MVVGGGGYDRDSDVISIRSQGEEVFSLRSTAERTGRQRPTFDFHPTSRLKAGKLLEEVRAQPQVEKNKTRAAPPVSAVEGVGGDLWILRRLSAGAQSRRGGRPWVQLWIQMSNLQSNEAEAVS